MLIRPLRTAQDIFDHVIKGSDNTVDRGVTLQYCGPDADSVQAFQDFADEAKCPKAVQLFFNYHNKEWAGGVNWTEAMNRLRFGWPDGVKRCEHIRAQLTNVLPRAQKPIVHFRPSVAPVGGLTLNLHDIISGGPQPFIGQFKDPSQTKQGRKIVKIAVNSCYSAGVPTRVAEARGATIMALVQQLILAKFSPDITVVFPCGREKFVTVWHVAPAGSSINQDQMAFTLISAAALRLMAHSMHAYVTGDAGYIPAPLRSVAPKMAESFDMVIESECAYVNGNPTIKPNWEREDSQVKWVKEMLKTQGVQFQGEA